MKPLKNGMEIRSAIMAKGVLDAVEAINDEIYECSVIKKPKNKF
jgi:hypothetical protein